ncbi:MAG: PilZ domain-containing protein [Candidatus Omnitrophota bacterium]
MEDRRMFARITLNVPLKFMDVHTGVEGVGETVDLSANGVGFISAENKPILSTGVGLEMWLNIPDQHEPLYVKGTVIWTKATPEGKKQRVGVSLEREELLHLARILWVKNKAR